MTQHENQKPKKAAYQMIGARAQGYMEEEDFYQTPPVATEELLQRWRPSGMVWEPACGYGAISRVLKANGIDVVSTDLVYRGFGCRDPLDFLSWTEPFGDAIITNPPYNISTDFVAHALELVPQAAFLLRLAWLEGIDRYRRIYSQETLAKVLPFARRLPRMHKEGYTGPKSTSAIAFAWFVFDAQHHGKPELDIIY